MYDIVLSTKCCIIVVVMALQMDCSRVDLVYRIA